MKTFDPKKIMVTLGGVPIDKALAKMKRVRHVLVFGRAGTAPALLSRHVHPDDTVRNIPADPKKRVCAGCGSEHVIAHFDDPEACEWMR